jgi:hypothetical protein
MGKSDLPVRRHAEVSRPAAFLSEGRRMPVERSSQSARPKKRYPHKNARWIKFIVAGFSCSGLVAFLAPALAFRPFDGTDAEVAELNHFDIELQPFGALQEGPDKKLVAPEAVINYGFAKDWEAQLGLDHFATLYLGDHSFERSRGIGERSARGLVPRSHS